MKSSRFAVPFLLIALLPGVTASAAPLRDYTWQLHHPDWPRMEASIRQAARMGATEIQLSHGIIEAVDQLNDESETAELVRKAAALCDELGLDTSVWAKELNIGKNRVDQDLDPNGGGAALWAERQAAYRRAFEVCPSVDRVVLQFGSCPTEIWYVRKEVSEFNAATPCAERIALTIAKIKEVCDAYGKGLDVRDFNHSPDQQDCVQAGLQLSSGVRAMIKEVPQDWQPYYPLNPLIGDVGANESYVEFDLGAEYWGKSALPFPLVDYLAWRIHNMTPRGITGVVVRVERGSDGALGTLNEMNLYAMSRLVQDPGITGAGIYDAWIEEQFGLPPGSDASKALRGIFHDLFEAGRKMFYVRHHWALEKGSLIPERVETAMLSMKNLPQWNPDYTEDWKRMRKPDAGLLQAIWQEKSEAVALADRAKERLSALQDALKPGDFAEIADAIEDWDHYARIWRAISDGIFRAAAYRLGKTEEDQARLEWDARYLETHLETGPELALAPKSRIRSFVADLRKRFDPVAGEVEAPGAAFGLPEFATTEDGALRVTWPMIGEAQPVLEYSEQLPHWPRSVVMSAIEPGVYQGELTGLPEDGPLFLRMRAGSESESGEFWYFR